MKYYKITLGGRGAEVFPFKINKDQYEVFRDKGVEHDELDYDEICEILEVESYFDCPNETIIMPKSSLFGCYWWCWYCIFGSSSKIALFRCDTIVVISLHTTVVL